MIFEVPRKKCLLQAGAEGGGTWVYQGTDFPTGHMSQLLGIVEGAMDVLHTLIFLGLLVTFVTSDPRT